MYLGRKEKEHVVVDEGEVVGQGMVVGREVVRGLRYSLP